MMKFVGDTLVSNGATRRSIESLNLDAATVTLTTARAKQLVSAELSDDGWTIKVKLDGFLATPSRAR